MENSYRFFENRACKYFPCHEGLEEFNCLFCYCPLYRLERCAGKPYYIEKDGKKIKVCSDCTFPHRPENYDKIMEILRQNM
ncbi:MAG: metal-binding protein [Lachnospiraceae bacterium]|nr:metal-binding protein [Lachnospiraceae bacterium]